ncbi:MAG: hypothetical protein AB7K24_32495 [Gemmataceae bacterium]
MATKTKELIRPIPSNWFMRNPHLVRFFIRELSAFFVFGYAVFLMVLLSRLKQGDQVFTEFVANVMLSPVSIVLHGVALLMVGFHSVTSFNAAPTIMPVRIGEDKVNPNFIVAANYALWAVASVAVLVLALKSW